LPARPDLNAPFTISRRSIAVAEMAQQGILKATKGRYIPGPMLALKSIHEGLKVPLEKGLELEKAFCEVVLTHQAKGSINTFFIQGDDRQTQGHDDQGDSSPSR